MKTGNNFTQKDGGKRPQLGWPRSRQHHYGRLRGLGGTPQQDLSIGGWAVFGCLETEVLAEALEVSDPSDLAMRDSVRKSGDLDSFESFESRYFYLSSPPVNTFTHCVRRYRGRVFSP